MANRAASLRQADLTRYIAATVKAGVLVQRVMIAPDGTVTLITTQGAADESANPCDRLLD